MTIPKQPRTKASAPQGAESAPPQSDAGGANPGAAQDVQQTTTGAAEALTAAYLGAHREQIAAYLAWLDKLVESATQAPQPAPAAAAAAGAQTDVAAATEAYRNYLVAQVDQHVITQKSLLEAASSYVQTLKESQGKLEEQVRQQNQSVADALKDALVKTEVRPENVQSLALLYHGLRSMGGAVSGATVSA